MKERGPIAGMNAAAGRRDFLKGAAFLGGAAAVAPAFASTGGKPLLKIAVMSDLQGHAYAEDAGMRNLERALDIFAPLKPDVVVSAGDMNDTGKEADAVAWFKARCDARLGKLPHVACIGNHELGFVPNRLKAQRTSEVCRRDFCAVFGDRPELVLRKTIGGYDFISLSLEDPARYHEKELQMLKRELDAAVARDSSRPIFVVSHYHPYGTVNDSYTRLREGGLREILNGYPQVVSLSGHTHNPLQDPRSIWQGEFTAIETSTLCYGCINNNPPAVNQISSLLPYGHEALGCIFIEVYGERMAVRRFSVRSRSEIEPENPWVVDLPYDPSKARYAFAPRAAKERTAGLTAGCEPTVWYDFGFIYLMWDAPERPETVFGYRVELAGQDGSAKSYFLQSDFYRLAAHRQSRVVFKAPPHSLEPGGSYRCRVVPVGFFGTEGRAVEWSFTVLDGYKCKTEPPNFVQE